VTTVKPPVTTAPTSTAPTTQPATSAPEATDTEASTTVATTAEEAAATAESSTLPATPRITIVFGVGVGDEAEGARVTVRGQGLRPGSSTDVTVHSDPILLASIEVPASGAFQQDVLLPHLEDGEHLLVAQGVGHDGTAVERQIGFDVDGGKLSRIGTAYASTGTASDPSSDAAAQAGAADPALVAEPSSSAHGRPVLPLLLILLALAGLGYLAWRIYQRRHAAATTVKPADRLPASASSGPLVLRTGSQPLTGARGR
jgi:hypothetical protein